MDQKKEKVKTGFVKKALFYIIPLIGMLYIRFVAATSRIIESRRDIPDGLIKQDRKFIFTLWHGRQFFLGYIRRNDKIKIMISASADGEYIARIIRYFGMGAVRGSSTRGGAKALVGALKALREGYIAGITPDGPKGPPLKVQMGAVVLAAKSGCPLIPLSYGAKRKKIINSWDSYLIPLPFNKIAVTYGDPIYISPDDNFEEKAALVERKLNEIALLSDELASK